MPKLVKPNPGDLVHVIWFDASTGIRLSGRESVPVDVTVNTVGIYIGTVGKQIKQLILVQNGFQYADGIFDLDYTSIPIAWITSLTVVKPSLIPPEVADRMLECFVAPGYRAHAPMGIRRRRTHNHD